MTVIKGDQTDNIQELTTLRTQQRIREALDLIDGSARAALGGDPERDRRLASVWRRSSATSYSIDPAE